MIRSDVIWCLNGDNDYFEEFTSFIPELQDEPALHDAVHEGMVILHLGTSFLGPIDSNLSDLKTTESFDLD